MSTELGRRAEDTAVAWLVDHGFNILARNWRNRWCEIDIVAEKAGIVRIVEVKYRASTAYGSGFDYITADKQKRLRRAALMWLAENNHAGEDCQIDVMAVLGSGAAQTVDYLANAIESA